MLTHLLHALIWTRRHLAGELSVPELSPLLARLSPRDVFLDVGAHAGSWAIPASRVLREGHVYGFEALPYYARVLKLSLKLLRRPNVTVVPAAVSDSPGTVSIVWRDAGGERLTGRTHIQTRGELGDAITVEAVTIDDFCREHGVQHVRLIKLDVEGAELMALRGASATIARWRPLVFCELYEEHCGRYGYAIGDVFAFFAARQYEPKQFRDGRYGPVIVQRYAGRGDILFVPAELEASTRCA